MRGRHNGWRSGFIFKGLVVEIETRKNELMLMCGRKNDRDRKWDRGCLLSAFEYEKWVSIALHIQSGSRVNV